MKRPRKPVTLTKLQIENLLDKLFNIDTPVVPRTVMTDASYDYAWTVWASRRPILQMQGKHALSRSKRKREILP